MSYELHLNSENKQDPAAHQDAGVREGGPDVGDFKQLSVSELQSEHWRG